MSEETTEMSEEAFEELWAQWDERLKAVGIHHGVPLGYGQEDIRVVARTRDSNITPFTDVNQREPENDDPDVINFWRLKRPWKGHHGYVAICRKEGKTCKAFVPHNSPATERIDMLIKTGSVRLNSALASAETKAREKLQSMLEPHQWKCYMLNDMFGERGHSGVLYFIRKGRCALQMK